MIEGLQIKSESVKAGDNSSWVEAIANLTAPHKKARFELPIDRATKKPIVEYAGQQVPDDFVPWKEAYEDYEPTKYTDNVVKENAKLDPDDPKRWAEDDWETVKASGKKFISFEGPVKLDEKTGMPLNPKGRTGRAERGVLGKWGANFAADNIITKSEPDGDYVLLITREDGQLAFPAGMIDTGESPRMAGGRELFEETGLKWSDVDLGDANVVYRGYVDDSRNRDNAWMETTAMHKHLDSKNADKVTEAVNQIQSKAEKEGETINKPKWVKITPELKKKMFASHGDMLGLVQLEYSKNTVSGQRHPYLESGKIPEQVLLPKIGLFGTAGDSTWRQEFIKKSGLPSDTFFNPQKGVGEWDINKDPILEAENLAKDKVITFAITNDTESYGSLAEIGFAILGAILRGQKVGVLIEDSEKFSTKAKRARNMIRSLLSRFQNLEENVKEVGTLEELVEWSKDALNSEPKPIKIPAISTDLVPRILLSGSSGSDDGAPSKMRKELVAKLTNKKIPYDDTYVPGGVYTRLHGEREANLKMKAAVMMHTITDETDSLTALGEVSTLAASAFANGQALCVYLEPGKGDRKNDTNKSRAIVRSSMEKLLNQYPGIVYFVEGKDGELSEEDKEKGLITRKDAEEQLVDVASSLLMTYTKNNS